MSKESRIHDRQCKQTAYNYISTDHYKYAAYRKKQADDEQKDRAKDRSHTLRRFVSLLKPYVGPIAVSLVFAVAYALLNSYAPNYLGDAVDDIQLQVTNKLAGTALDWTSLKYNLFMTIFMYTIMGFCNFFQQFIMAGVSQKMLCGLRAQVNDKLSRLPLSYFDSHSKGDILSRLTNDVSNISSTLESNVLSVITNLVQVVGVLFLMFYQNWILALISVILSPLGALFSYKISRISKRWYRHYWRTMGDMNGHIEEMYTGHSINKLYNNEKKATEEYDEIVNSLQYMAVKSNFISGTISPVITFINNIVYVLVCYIGGLLITSGTGVTLGTITKFISYNSLFSTPLSSLSKLINSIQSSLACAERVFETLDEEEVPPETNEVTTLEPTGEVRFENVDFRYVEDKPLIEDFNMTAKPGDLIAIVGPTGAGKTTIINLLMRFYEIQGGRITIDGEDITSMPRELLRSQIGMVLQDTWIFKGTVRENIAYGKPDATDEEIIHAAKIARAHDFITRMANGYDTELSEDGTDISQGQRQLITIARAILTDPPVLILDEATSSVDTKTELKIQNAMRYIMKDRTSFVIAHRLSTIKNADNILVMRKGRVVEQGTHEELMSQESYYKMLHECQYEGGIPPEDDGE